MARMNRERREAANAAQLERLAQERAKASTAERFEISAKRAETLVRDFWYIGGLRSEADFRARKAGQVDMRIEGRPAEVKTGGTVGTPDIIYHTTEDELDEFAFEYEDIAPGAAWIVFPIIDRCEAEDELPDMTVVMTREEFKQELDAIVKRSSWKSAFKINGDTAHNHDLKIQRLVAAIKTEVDPDRQGKLIRKLDRMMKTEVLRSPTIGFQAEYLTKLRDRLDEAIAFGEYPTIRTKKEERDGA